MGAEGGHARAKNLSPERRRSIAQAAAKARWAEPREKKPAKPRAPKRHVVSRGRSHEMGHLVTYVGWYDDENVLHYTYTFPDTGEQFTDDEIKNARPCKACGERRTIEGHDPCIANLKGVNFACCGHGTGEGYIMLASGQVIRGLFDHLNPRWKRG